LGGEADERCTIDPIRTVIAEGCHHSKGRLQKYLERLEAIGLKGRGRHAAGQMSAETAVKWRPRARSKKERRAMRKNVSLLIKPASSLCNLRCKYCFYADVAANRELGSYGVMSPETQEQLIRAALEEAGVGGTVGFAFQGGEPTLAGLAYFQTFVALVRRISEGKNSVFYSIQTNGIVVDDEWAAFFKENHFLVGLSVDGGIDSHDQNRVDADGKGTWKRVTKTLRCLQAHEVDINLLCVVSRALSRRPLSVYRALKKLGAQYLQFIPCLDPLETERGSQPFSLLPEDYGKFLCTLFDAWFDDWKAGRYVSIRLFDDYVHLMMGLPAGTCATNGNCGPCLISEGDGGLYPCDFFVLDEWRLGAVDDGRTLGEIASCERERAFLAQSAQKPKECAACRWRRLCNGGCKRDWYEAEGETHNYFCPAFRMFFEHAEGGLMQIAAAERAALRGRAF